MLPDSSVHSRAEDLLYFAVQCALIERHIHVSFPFCPTVRISECQVPHLSFQKAQAPPLLHNQLL